MDFSLVFLLSVVHLTSMRSISFSIHGVTKPLYCTTSLSSVSAFSSYQDQICVDIYFFSCAIVKRAIDSLTQQFTNSQSLFAQ